MPYRILGYIISLSFLYLGAVPISAQQYSDNRQQQMQGTPKEKKPDGPKLKAPLYNGLYVSADLYGLGSKLLGSDFLSSEIGVGVNLKNQFMPTIELGYGKTNKWNENGIHYKSNAPYFRIGVDYNIRFKKLDYEDWLYFGVRYGYSSFKYTIGNAPIIDPKYGGKIDNPNLIDPIWGGLSIPYYENNINGSMSWYELVAGIRTKIYKNFFMGWTLRLRYKMSAKEASNASPWYVPGYGKYASTANGITYTLIYKFSLGAKKPTVVMPIEKKKVATGKKIIVHRGGNTPFNSK